MTLGGAQKGGAPSSPPARVEREAEGDAIITEWTRQHTKEEAMALVSGVGVVY